MFDVSLGTKMNISETLCPLLAAFDASVDNEFGVFDVRCENMTALKARHRDGGPIATGGSKTQKSFG